jgi:hypothetical protein
MASNVNAFVKRTHIEKFFKKDLDNLPVNSEELTFHENKYNFISKVLALFHIYSEERIIDELHNIVNVLLKIPDIEFEKKFFTAFTRDFDNNNDEKNNISLVQRQKKRYSIDEYLKFLRVIRVFLLKCTDFNIYEKDCLCKLERFLMKLYLKQLNAQ